MGRKEMQVARPGPETRWAAMTTGGGGLQPGAHGGAHARGGRESPNALDLAAAEQCRSSPHRAEVAKTMWPLSATLHPGFFSGLSGGRLGSGDATLMDGL